MEILRTWGDKYNQLLNNLDEIFIKEMSDCEIISEVPNYEEWKQLKEYERIVTSYNMKPIDYEIACETVNKLLGERKAFKEENIKLKELLKECRDEIAPYRNFASNKRTFKNLTDKINQALGDKNNDGI